MRVLIVGAPTISRDQIADMLNEIRGIELVSQSVVYHLYGQAPKKMWEFECLDPRFNAQPEKSTFTPRIHNKSKRWQK